MPRENILLDKVKHVCVQNDINERFLDYIIDYVISKRRPFIRPFVRLFFDLLIGLMVVAVFTQRLVSRNWQLVLLWVTTYIIMALGKYRSQLGPNEELTV
ncbi:m056R [Myxoma virus]|nr:m056R [Myxoma virus]